MGNRSRGASLLAGVLILGAACGDDALPRLEGTESGDCRDGADNDGDGLSDCDDDGCAMSPDCTITVDSSMDSRVVDVGMDGAPDALDVGVDALDAALDAPMDTTVSPDATVIDTGVPPDAAACVGGETRFYVAAVFDVGQADPVGDPSLVPGINVDGRISDGSDVLGCLHPDFTNPPPYLENGVDNQLGPILSAVGSSLDISGTIADAVLAGSFLVLLEIEHVDDPMNDPCVVLNIYQGLVPSGATAEDADGDLLLDPGQTFDIDASSVTSAGDPLATAYGRIVGGRLSAFPIDVSLPMPVTEGSSFLLDIRDATVRLTLAGDSFDHGVLGGSLDVEATVPLIVAIDPATIPEALARSVLSAQADLSPDSSGACRAVSIGVVMDGVPAARGVVR